MASQPVHGLPISIPVFKNTRTFIRVTEKKVQSVYDITIISSYIDEVIVERGGANIIGGTKRCVIHKINTLTHLTLINVEVKIHAHSSGNLDLSYVTAPLIEGSSMVKLHRCTIQKFYFYVMKNSSKITSVHSFIKELIVINPKNLSFTFETSE